MRAIVSKPFEDGGELVFEVDITSHQDYYTHLECSTFDVVMVKWGEHFVSIFVDDEGLMKAGNLGRIVKGCPNPLFGTFVITGGVDSKGETLPLDEAITFLDIQEFIGRVEFIVKD